MEEFLVCDLLSARATAGKGWQHLAFPMACFIRDGDDFSAVTQPFVLDGNGTGRGGRRQREVRQARHIQRNLPELLLLLAIFPRDERPSSPLRQINNRVNAIISGFTDERNIFFMNINESLMNADGTLSKDILPDLLHLSEKGYGIWALRLEPTLQKLLSQPQSSSNTKAE